MTVHNMEVANCLNKLANLLEIEGANPFRVRAYRNAARIITSLSKNVSDLVDQGADLTLLPGIGADLAGKIETLVKTGSLPLLQEIEGRLPPLLNELMQVEGLGPKRIMLIYKKLKIKDISTLKVAIEKGRLQKLKGFGEKIEQKILQGIAHKDRSLKRFKFAETSPIVDDLTQYLKKLDHVNHVECAGSFRRRKETVADLDFLVTANNGQKVIDYFVQYTEVAEIISQGSTRSTVRLKSGIQVDLRVVPEISYGAALLYFTGSKDHNIAIRKIGVQKKLKINEYGVFKGKKQIAGRTESEVYATVGLPYIEPELREDRGEIEAAANGNLPHLIKLKDIRGDLHCHIKTSDKPNNLKELANAAISRHYEYFAITTYNASRKLDKKAFLEQMKEIDKLNSKLHPFVILKSMDVDILENGKLSLPDDILKELDLTVCAIRTKYDLPAEKQSERIIRAMDNFNFNIFAHPAGRLINQPDYYAVNIERIMFAAKERGCVLELNAQPNRLDLSDINCKMAKDFGIKIAISTAAQEIAELDYMALGIFQARRGWLEKHDVINTTSLSELMNIIKR